MTSKIRSRALSGTIAGVVLLADLDEGAEGVHSRSLSLARQWGRFGEGRGRRLLGYGRGLGAVESDPLDPAGEGSGESKRAGLDSIVLEDVEDQLVLELGLCSGSFSCFLLSTPLGENPGSTSRVLFFFEVPEFSSGEWVCSVGEEIFEVLWKFDGWE